MLANQGEGKSTDKKELKMNEASPWRDTRVPALSQELIQETDGTSRQICPTGAQATALEL